VNQGLIRLQTERDNLLKQVEAKRMTLRLRRKANT
jgi:hypothetical protein